MNCKECGQACSDTCTCGIPICSNCEAIHFGVDNNELIEWIKGIEEIKEMERRDE